MVNLKVLPRERIELPYLRLQCNALAAKPPGLNIIIYIGAPTLNNARQECGAYLRKVEAA